MNVQVLDTTQKRLSILGDDEIAALYSRPCFTHDERTQYFSLSQPEKEVLQDLRSVTSQAYFVLQLGYFKARHLFFTFDLDEVAEDLQYVLEHHFPTREMPARTSIDKFTKRKQQHVILALYHYRSCHAEERQQLAAKARQAARVCAKPVYIFRALLQYMTEQRLVAPGYSFMQDTVGQALTYEQERLTTLVAQALNRTNIEALHRLLDDAPGLYELTQFKREPRDFSASEIKRERHRGAQLRALYHLANTLLPALNISNESIKYYASLVNYYSVYKLKRLQKATVYVYLLCFVYHRYQKHHDNLIHSLLYNVRRYTDEAKAAAKDRVYEAHTEGNENLDKAGQVLKLFTDDRIAQQTPFSEVQAQAFSILERHQIDFIADHLTTHVTFDETAFQWEHMDELAHQFKRHLRPIVVAVDFTASSAQTPLMEAVHFLQTAFHKGQPLGHYPASAFPIRCIPEASTRYLYAQDPQGHRHVLPDRYEFLVYRLLRNRLEAGLTGGNVRHYPILSISLSHKSLLSHNVESR